MDFELPQAGSHRKKKQKANHCLFELDRGRELALGAKGAARPTTTEELAPEEEKIRGE
ncbi:hypothetical protein F2Q70_00016707 [Brassica cretica]|uniref:Uncharacterized protein n=1 Tax=Brassica cretica TaxID=69181 RepID=A0A8S9HU96_BRACR|nr:hypothetical protein F2Q70_00016707 [Brassica cretica]